MLLLLLLLLSGLGRPPQAVCFTSGIPGGGSFSRQPLYCYCCFTSKIAGSNPFSRRQLLYLLILLPLPRFSG
jgi:hypothetical protein